MSLLDQVCSFCCAAAGKKINIDQTSGFSSVQGFPSTKQGELTGRLTTGQAQLSIKCRISLLEVFNHLPAGFVSFPLHHVDESTGHVCFVTVVLEHRVGLALVQQTLFQKVVQELLKQWF